MTHEIRKLSGVSELRAFAHPLRQALYEQVVLFGPLTATELAHRLGESPSNCSWHLRKLAEHGLVVEAEGAAGPARPWRAAAAGLSWDEGDEASDAEAGRAGEALTRMLLDRERARRDMAVERLRSDDPAWRDAAETHQALVWLTADELAAIHAQLRSTVSGYAGRHEDVERRPEGARLCALVEWGVPAYVDALPSGTPDAGPPAAGRETRAGADTEEH
jgi:predicted ArsR family transcriptional regulator